MVLLEKIHSTIWSWAPPRDFGVFILLFSIQNIMCMIILN